MASTEEMQLRMNRMKASHLFMPTRDDPLLLKGYAAIG
jgi:hypothetical protein